VHFEHAPEIWRDFPELVPGVLFAEGIAADASVADRVDEYGAVAASRLASASEGELPEVQAWRRAFSRMGLEPTRYRCASEALLRRFRKEGSLPRIHPLVDLCNAVSLAFAIPVAVFDVAEVDEHLEVRRATGDETYLAFSGETESPEHGEVIFADAAGRVHARRWTNRQSASSAVREPTTAVLIVAEALHNGAHADVERLIATLAQELRTVWSARPETAILSADSPRFQLV
jgi:DNA/RNA-binding domain of Phe-tRNA-synthetase-like protein